MAYLRGGRSAFPNGEDNFLELFDLSHNQLQSAKRLNELRLQESLTNSEQNEMISLLASLRDNLITPEDMNLMGDAIYNLQKFFNEEVFDFILARQAEWNTYVNNFKYIGKWTAGTAYKAQNMVHNTKGDLFIARRNHTASGTEPSETTADFAKLSAKGDKGDPGISHKYRGDWNSTTSYAIGDAVTYMNTGVDGGLVYLAKKASTGANPSTDGTAWMLYTKDYFGNTQPPAPSKGLHYHQIIG